MGPPETAGFPGASQHLTVSENIPPYPRFVLVRPLNTTFRPRTPAECRGPLLNWLLLFIRMRSGCLGAIRRMNKLTKAFSSAGAVSKSNVGQSSPDQVSLNSPTHSLHVPQLRRKKVFPCRSKRPYWFSNFRRLVVVRKMEDP